MCIAGGQRLPLVRYMLVQPLQYIGLLHSYFAYPTVGPQLFTSTITSTTATTTSTLLMTFIYLISAGYFSLPLSSCIIYCSQRSYMSCCVDILCTIV